MKNEKNGGRRLRLTDFFLILLFLLCVAGVVFRVWDLNDRAPEESVPFAVAAEWRNADVRTAACLREGDVLYTAAGEIFGTVTSVTGTPARVRLREGGALYEGVYPDDTRCDLRLTVQVNGRLSGGILLRDGTREVNAGQVYRLYSDLVEIPLFVLFYPEKTVSE